MLARVRIDFACNDPDNGVFAGKVAMAAYHLDAHTSIEFESPGLREFKFTLPDRRHAIRLHRREFPFVARTAWYGNWCWDSFTFDRPVAKALLGTLRSNGWAVDNVPVVWAERFWERRPVAAAA